MNIKSENGITLLTLVVTLIVMTILAAIVISASVGDNGLVKKTEEGVIVASIREVEEAIDVKILLKEKDLIKNGNYSGVTIDDLEADGILKSKSGNTYVIDISKLDIKGKYGIGNSDKDVFKLEDKGNGTYIITYVAADGTVYDDE